MMMATSSRAAPSSMITTQQQQQQQQQRRNYHENIVEHYENPRNVGSLDKNSDDVGTVSVYCSDYPPGAGWGAKHVYFFSGE